jgi:REP element-mobilizing transposase RayT
MATVATPDSMRERAQRRGRAKWGGARAGAGRKPKQGLRSTPHRSRPLHSAEHPVHVTLRARLKSLRNRHVFPTLVGVIAAQRRRGKSFRIVHFSVQYNHLHLIVEARNKVALSSGVRALVISIARRVNELISERGRFWADRYHARALTTPRAVRTALRYVLAISESTNRARVPSCGRIRIRRRPGSTGFESAALVLCSNVRRSRFRGGGSWFRRLRCRRRAQRSRSWPGVGLG